MTEITLFESIMFIIAGSLLVVIAYKIGNSDGKRQGWKESNDFCEQWMKEGESSVTKRRNT